MVINAFDCTCACGCGCNVLPSQNQSRMGIEPSGTITVHQVPQAGVWSGSLSTPVTAGHFTGTIASSPVSFGWGSAIPYLHPDSNDKNR